MYRQNDGESGALPRSAGPGQSSPYLCNAAVRDCESQTGMFSLFGTVKGFKNVRLDGFRKSRSITWIVISMLSAPSDNASEHNFPPASRDWVKTSSPSLFPTIQYHF